MSTYIGLDKLKSVYIDTDKIKSVYVDLNKVYSSGPPKFKFTMNFNSSAFVSSPDTCLTYADDCAGYTPVSGPGSSGSTPAKCTNIGSWVMKSDGTSDNPLLNQCFYATFTSSGALHEKLNPQDLSQKIGTWDGSKWVSASGSSSITTENTMFCIPTLYVSSSATHITLSNDPSYGGQAFAHTMDGHTYAYVGISVYPGYNESSKLVSKSGKSSSVSISQANLKTYAKAITVQNGHSVLMNWHIWQLYRLIVLFAMRHFNSQARIGQGGQAYGAKTTGLMNALGPFAGSSSTSTGDSQGVKAFIENPWGHNYEYLGDYKYLSSGEYVWNTSAQSESSTSGGVRIDASPYGVTFSSGLASGAISPEPLTWGMGTASGGSATTGGCDYQYIASSSYPFGFVGGYSGIVSNGRAGFSYLSGSDGGARSDSGGRSAFVFDI